MANTRNRNRKSSSYLWEDIPADLLKRTQQRLNEELPPRALKWLLLELLRDWDDAYTARPTPRTIHGRRTVVR